MQANSILQGVLFSSLLLAASYTDIKRREIPDTICALLVLTGFLKFSYPNLLGIFVALPFLIAAMFKEKSIGGGDIKLTAAVGFVLGFWKGIYGLIIGLILLILFYIMFRISSIIRKKQVVKNLSMPLAPFLVICIVLSLLICFGITPLFNKGISQKTKIVRVTKEIKSGDEITKDMVQVVEVGGFNLPENVIRTKETAIGKFAVSDFGIGDYILNTKLSEMPAAENAYLYNLDGSKQAMSITIKTFANGLSGKLQSGDIVSVIAPDYKKQGATVIPAELKYVEVISVTASSGYDANTNEQGTQDERELPSTVTLLVTPEQANILAELEADSKFHLSLVYRGSPENTKKFIGMQEKIIEALYYPEPEEDTEEVSEEVIVEDAIDSSNISAEGVEDIGSEVE